MGEPRFSVGIDLGTTNSALAEVDLAVQPAGPGEPLPGALPFSVTQVFAPGEVSQSDLLPSFVYLPSPHEAPAGSLAPPWAPERTWTVGQYARDRGALVPMRLVSSAKSWLSHPGVDKRGALLPLKAPGDTAADDVPRISPVEASARLLGHLREAWEDAHKDAFEGPLKLADQAVTLTVPASFDPQARELTVAAAAQAGLPKLTLLEEPQAALYAWVQACGDDWRTQVKPGDVILVLDVGGGTSDFSLIGVREEGGSLALERLAVGDHILLGGDNLDLALAHTVNARLAASGTKLDSWQFAALTFACRKAKESPKGPADSIPLTIPGRGSSLLGGLVRTELTGQEQRQVSDAFFPEVELSAQVQAARRTGLTTLGLPYAQDPAVTRHLAAFLRRHASGLKGLPAGHTFLHPTAVLFNGGVFKDERLRERVGKLVDAWVMREGGRALTRLTSQGPFDALDLGVALGAAYSGLARRGRGIRIRGGLPRAYYVGVESAAPAVPGFDPPIKAVCLAPFGLEEGTQIDLPQLELGAVVGEQTRFRFFSSDQRRDDLPGAVVDDTAELSELPELLASLDAGAGLTAGAVVPVGLRAAVTEVGTLSLQLVAREGAAREWKLEFSVRESSQGA